MNLDRVISLLAESNWLFLAGWVLLLGTAFVASFPEKLLSATPKANQPTMGAIRH